MNMEYVLTEHARDALEKRQIPLAWMERAWSTPEATEADENVHHVRCLMDEVFGEG